MVPSFLFSSTVR
jgi:hypothetical protein